MARKVYDPQKQYEITTKIEAEIKAVWTEIKIKYFFEIFPSMTKNLLEALDAKLNATKF